MIKVLDAIYPVGMCNAVEPECRYADPRVCCEGLFRSKPLPVFAPVVMCPEPLAINCCCDPQVF